MNSKNTKPGDKTTTIDMPEVKDIPGQENIRPPRIREMEDTTVSSDDEEGKGVIDELNTEHPPVNPIDAVPNSTPNRDTDVTEEEKRLLDKTDRPDDSDIVEKVTLDNTDGEDLLNEEGVVTDMGEGLDVPGAELDDDNEEIGEEDEENNPYTNSNADED